MGLLGLNLLSTRLFPSRAKAPPAKTAGDYARLSIPFSPRFQTSKMDMKPSSLCFALSIQMLVFIYPIQDTSVCLGGDKE